MHLIAQVAQVCIEGGGSAKINEIHDFASCYTFLSYDGYSRRWRFSVKLVCLLIDIDHSKFEPRSVSHRGAVRHAHHRHR